MATYAGRYDEVLLRRAGNRVAPPISGTTVLVYESDGSTTATLYTDRTKATTAANPVSVDASGNVEFFAEPGTYVLSIREDGSEVATDTVTVFNDPAEETGGGGGAVDSVNGQTGVVVLDADDIDDAATTNRFATAAQLTKLDGIESGATADQTAAEILAALLTVDGAGSGLNADLLDGSEGSAFATSGHAHDATYQPLDADLTALAAAGNSAILAATTASFTSADETKLDGIESGATADQTATEIVAKFTGTPDGTLFLRDDGTLAAASGGGGGATNLAWSAATSTVSSDTGTDATLSVVDGSNPGLMSVADKSKLDGVEALADVTDAINVAAAGAVMATDAAGGDLAGTYPNPTIAPNAISDQTETVAPRRIFETALGVWSDDAPSGRSNYQNTIEYVGVTDPTDVTNGIATPANIVAGDVWREVSTFV